MDPVLHLVRNAVSHGIETPEERVGRRQDAGGHHPAGGVDGRRSPSCSRLRDDGGASTEAIGGRARAAGIEVAGRPARRARCCSTSSARRASRRATKPTARAVAASAWPSSATRSRNWAAR